MTVLNFAVRALVPARKRSAPRRWPGSPGEHLLQERLGTADRARQFYRKQVTQQLTPVMAEFIGRMEMAFIATSDAAGECDCSFRAGDPGFILVLDDRTIAYPEYRGNGVMASMGNMLLNPHIGIFMADFTRDLIGLHINGDTDILTPDQMRQLGFELPEPQHRGKQPVMWVLITITEAYIHCTKRIPTLVPQSRIGNWATDNPRDKGGNYFGVIPAEESA
jgi:predicted pyridoxine 5'-phosphate oxidase superfamily flavin-nucleotide-binding protein